MKILYIILFILFNLISFKISAEMLILDRLDNPGKTTQNQKWSFVTDGVMGGLSQGSAKVDKINGTDCYKMTGNVTTENNGGFIQIRTILIPSIDAID